MIMSFTNITDYISIAPINAISKKIALSIPLS
jgi:hypothetical protein